MNQPPEHKCDYPPVRITAMSGGALSIEYAHAEQCIEDLERMKVSVEAGWYQPSALEKFAFSLLSNMTYVIKRKKECEE